MTREELLAQLLIEAAMPGPLPGVSYDSPADQKARRDALLADLHATDKYRRAVPPVIKFVVRAGVQVGVAA